MDSSSASTKSHCLMEFLSYKIKKPETNITDCKYKILSALKLGVMCLHNKMFIWQPPLPNMVAVQKKKKSANNIHLFEKTKVEMSVFAFHFSTNDAVLILLTMK